MPQAAARCIKHQGRRVPADQSHLLVEVRGRTRRETPAGHNEPGHLCCAAKFSEALLLLDERQARPSQHEPILQAGADLVDGEALSRRTLDLDTSKRDTALGEEVGIDVTGRTARGEDRRHRRPQIVGHLRDIDAAAAGVVPNTGAADLVGGAHHLGIRGDVERRVHRQCDNRCFACPTHDVDRTPWPRLAAGAEVPFGPMGTYCPKHS